MIYPSFFFDLTEKAERCFDIFIPLGFTLQSKAHIFMTIDAYTKYLYVFSENTTDVALTLCGMPPPTLA